MAFWHLAGIWDCQTSDRLTAKCQGSCGIFLKRDMRLLTLHGGIIEIRMKSVAIKNGISLIHFAQQ